MRSRLSSPHSGLSFIIVGVLIVVGLLGCDAAGLSGGGEPEASPVSLSVSATDGTGAGALQTQAKGLRAQRVTDSAGNRLQFDRVELVLQSIVFERTDVEDGCDDGQQGCEELEAGPLRVVLPLESTSPSVVVDTTLPAGTWEEAAFTVGVPSDPSVFDDPPFPSGVSIRAQGTFTPAGGTSQEFTFLSDLSEERELEFEPPLEVTPEEPTNVTFAVDLSTWFRRADSTLVNPALASDGGRFADLVEENIESSIEGFEDNDFDGEDDHDEEENEDDEESETEIEVELENTGPDPDASGEAEYEQESGEKEFAVEVEDLDLGTYQVVVDDTVRGDVEVVTTDDGTEGEIEFRNPAEDGHPILEFDPRGSEVAIVQNGTTYLEADMPTEQSGDDDGDDDGDDNETEIEVDLENTGPDPDASGEAEFELENDRRKFEVEVEDLSPGTYDVVVADTSRAELEISGGGDSEAGIEFRDPVEDGHPLLDFDPRGAHVAVSKDGTTYLEVDFPSEEDDD
jgi:hypothetical protein